MYNRLWNRFAALVISYNDIIVQEIWFLVSKFSIPVVDSDTDILILIDDICRDDSPDPLLDNSISDEVVTMMLMMMVVC